MPPDVGNRHVQLGETRYSQTLSSKGIGYATSGAQGRPVCGWTGTRRTSAPASGKDRQHAQNLCCIRSARHIEQLRAGFGDLSCVLRVPCP